MSSAQLDIQPLDESIGETEEAPFALKEQVAERLAAHRARRGRALPSSVTPIAQPSSPRGRSAQIAAAVAERYAQSQSYRDFIAEEAERAIREAQAAAEVAAVSARAIAEAQNQLLFELDQIAAEASTLAPDPYVVPFPQAETFAAAPALHVPEAPAPAPPVEQRLTIRHYEQVPHYIPDSFAVSYPSRANDSIDEMEALALDDEIAFRQSPVFDEIGPPVDIPANLIEFPRQLVAARKARPRLAEGPLREDADATPHSAQLRIFEVESTQITTAPIVEAAAPEWSSILLGAQPAPAPVVENPEAAQFSTAHIPQTAALNLRLMAGIVDACIVLASFMAFAAIFAVTVTRVPGAQVGVHLTPQIAGIASAVALIFLGLAYQLLFFTFSDATPGMRYARIGLCTFSDDNPTRAAMRRRIFAVILSVCPVGIGFLWCFLDEDGLGWHDRISHMYQRSY